MSADIVGEPHAAIVDLSLTKVVDGDLCAVYSWYDNEGGYTHALLEHVLHVARHLSTSPGGTLTAAVRGADVAVG